VYVTAAQWRFADNAISLVVRAREGAAQLAPVVRQAIGPLTGLGVAIGVAGAAVATQAIVAMLFGVSRLDPATYLGLTALLAGVAKTACAVPAWRAARVDPASTLRSE
jgi:ABC-type lipoprotein release transport system permease subunit